MATLVVLNIKSAKDVCLYVKPGAGKTFIMMLASMLLREENYKN